MMALAGKILNLLKTMIARLIFRDEPSPQHWVFSSVHNQTFNYNSRYLFLYVKEHCPQIHPYYIVNDDELRKKLSEQYGAAYFIETKTWKGIWKVLSCKVWFTSTAPPLYGTGFRRKYIIVNLWHGVPLKTIGMMQKNLSLFTRKYYKYFFADNYEAVLTTSRKMIPIMSKSFLVEPERIRVWGQPRNDVLFRDKSESSMVFSLWDRDNTHGEENNHGNHRKYRILYAPTFRDHGETRLFPFSEFAVGNPSRNVYIEQMQQWLLQNNICIYIRMHLYDCTENEWIRDMDVPGSPIRLLNEDRVEDIMEVLNQFDLLITDYSSIYIDYLLTGNPIIFLPYDREEYLADRGLNFPYDEVTPGPKPETLQELLNSVENLLYNTDDYAQQREELNQYFNEIQSPCCEKICQHVMRLVTERN